MFIKSIPANICLINCNFEIILAALCNKLLGSVAVSGFKSEEAATVISGY